jgi:hypothetical protein
MMLTSGAASPPRIGLKPKDARAASAWPRKLQTLYLSPTREARRSSRQFWVTTSSCIHVELTGQDLCTGVLQSFLLPLEVSLTVVEAGLAGA